MGTMCCMRVGVDVRPDVMRSAERRRRIAESAGGRASR
jgi:hypothetical protein